MSRELDDIEAELLAAQRRTSEWFDANIEALCGRLGRIRTESEESTDRLLEAMGRRGEQK